MIIKQQGNVKRDVLRMTHERFIHAVRDIVASRLPESADREHLQRVKLTYGAGDRNVRGVTYYNAWRPNHGSHGCVDFAAINARHQEGLVQLAGTTIHELGHVLAGAGSGHSETWKDACYRLGLRRIKAAGTHYQWAMFAPDVRAAIISLGSPDDGMPAFGLAGMLGPQGAPLRGLPVCTHGVGSRGGKSRGAGSGSRMRKYTCQCGQIVRAATDTLNATHNDCGSAFTLATLTKGEA